MNKIIDKEKTAYYKTKLGMIEIRYTDDYITYLSFVEDNADNNASITSPLSDKTYQEINEYLDGKRTEFDIPIKLIGTEFQKKVWQALLEIDYGKTLSYKDIAEKIGKPKSARAVGGANNKNRIAIIVPCHRVIASNGALLGYAGGVDIKKKLLKIESTNNGK